MLELKIEEELEILDVMISNAMEIFPQFFEMMTNQLEEIMSRIDEVEEVDPDNPLIGKGNYVLDFWRNIILLMEGDESKVAEILEMFKHIGS